MNLLLIPKMQTKKISSLMTCTTVFASIELKRTEPSTAREAGEEKSLKFWFKIITHDAKQIAWLHPRTRLGTRSLMFSTSIHTISAKNRTEFLQSKSNKSAPNSLKLPKKNLVSFAIRPNVRIAPKSLLTEGCFSFL